MNTQPQVIHCDVQIMAINGQVIARLPEAASEKLSSRGQVAVTGTINGRSFQTVLEPDGYWGHWMRAGDTLQQTTVGETVTLSITQTKDWPEPTVPADFARALKNAPEKVKQKWIDITPMARWEWIRWVNATGNTDTRAVRIEKSVSKLAGKHRRPCCFNLAACTDPELSRSGRLLQPT